MLLPANAPVQQSEGGDFRVRTVSYLAVAGPFNTFSFISQVSLDLILIFVYVREAADRFL